MLKKIIKNYSSHYRAYHFPLWPTRPQRETARAWKWRLTHEILTYRHCVMASFPAMNVPEIVKRVGVPRLSINRDLCGQRFLTRTRVLLVFDFFCLSFPRIRSAIHQLARLESKLSLRTDQITQRDLVYLRVALIEWIFAMVEAWFLNRASGLGLFPLGKLICSFVLAAESWQEVGNVLKTP